jgi:hypothetical protein
MPKGLWPKLRPNDVLGSPNFPINASPVEYFVLEKRTRNLIKSWFISDKEIQAG